MQAKSADTGCLIRHFGNAGCRAAAARRCKPQRQNCAVLLENRQYYNLQYFIGWNTWLTKKFSNFLTEIIDADLAEEAGSEKRIHTRFPPEPNGYLHIGSAKAIYINYMTAKTYGGKFNLRFDDTSPRPRRRRVCAGILKDLEWLGATLAAAFFGRLL